MNSIAIIPNPQRDENLSETRKLLAFLSGCNKKILIEDKFKSYNFQNVCFSTTDVLMSKADIAVVLGGDGTILDIAPMAAKYNVPVLGINLGHLGFLAQAEKGNYDIFNSLFAGNYTIQNCIMLDCGIVKNNNVIASFTALNDVVAFGDGYSRMVNVSASVNGTNIGTYSADGLIAATAVGSTAYSLSAGGAILHPEMDAIILTPICPHTLKARSMVVPGSDKIEITPCPPLRTSVVVMIDGKRRHVLENDEHICITRSKYYTRLININNKNFFDVLREKLSD